MPSWIIGVFGSLVTLGIFVAGVIYKMGHHAARLQSLEEWRFNIRKDMHEISEKLEGISNQVSSLTTLVDERTERRILRREANE